MKAIKLWNCNLPEGADCDTTSAYLSDDAEPIRKILRSYDAAIIGQVLVCEDGCEDDIIEKINSVLSTEGDDETPFIVVHRDQHAGGFQLSKTIA